MNRAFKRAYVEITNRCNMSCSFCPGTRREKAFMDEGLYSTVLDRIKGFTEYIYFHVMGEPLLHPLLPVFLDLAGKRGFKVNITTNGTPMEGLLRLAGKSALRQVNFSLHGHAVEDEKVLKNIKAFISSRRDIKPMVSLRMWDAKKSGMEGFYTRMEGIFPEFMKKRGNLPAARGIELDSGVFYNEAERFKWPGLEQGVIGHEGFCLGLREQFGVLVDGTVVPCCLDAEGAAGLGNLKDSSMDEILASGRAVSLYDGFSNRRVVEPLCQRCGYRKRFDLTEKRVL